MLSYCMSSVPSITISSDTLEQIDVAKLLIAKYPDVKSFEFPSTYPDAEVFAFRHLLLL
jgi:hypothetical protein